VKLSLAYSIDEEITPIIPIIKGEISKGVKIEPKKVPLDEIKFNYNNYDIFYVQLPLLLYIKNIKVISNGAYIIEKLGSEASLTSSSSVCIENTSSTEFYLLKILLGYKGVPRKNGDCIKLVHNSDNISYIWREQCGNLPIVISLIGSTKLSDEEMSILKVVVRESASLQERRDLIKSYSKELGLKGREAINCFFKLCKEKNVCSEISYDIL
jgi:hypothetical protein